MSNGVEPKGPYVYQPKGVTEQPWADAKRLWAVSGLAHPLARIEGLTREEAQAIVSVLTGVDLVNDLRAQLAARDAEITRLTQEKARLQGERDRLARTLANDPAGAAKKLINLSKMYTVCDRCEQETTEANESNIVCDACLAKSEQAREALQARIEKIGKFCEHFAPCPQRYGGKERGIVECTCGLDNLLTDAPEGGQR